jgi:hypothetical protein
MIKKPLSGIRVGVSVSDSIDLQRFGFLESQLSRVLRELLNSLVYRGATIIYGGNFHVDGYTIELTSRAAEYWRTHEPGEELAFVHHAAAPLWRKLDAKSAWRHLNSLCNFGCIKIYGATELLVEFLPESHPKSANSRGGQSMRVSVDNVSPKISKVKGANVIHSEAEFGSYWKALLRARPNLSVAASYSTMRRGMAQEEQARIVLGGRVNDQDGYGSGIADEVILGLAADKLLLPFPAYGGCAHDAAVALKLATPISERRNLDPAYRAQLQKISSMADGYARKIAGLGLTSHWLEALCSADTPASVARVCVDAIQKIAVSDSDTSRP